MRLVRIYQQQDLYCGARLRLSEGAAHHLIHVLRLEVGAEFSLFNGQGGEFKATIISIKQGVVSVNVDEFKDIERESPLQITLAQAVLRPEKMDYVLQKTTELGVTHIIPLITERASLKLPAERWEKRFAHWQAVVINACEQSARTRIPTIAKPVSVAQGIDEMDAELRVFLTPYGTRSCLPRTTENLRIALLVGPEGGWSEDEIDTVLHAGYCPMRLGPRILRTETAGLVAIALFQSLWGDISLNLV